MRTTLRTVLVSLTAATALVTLTATPGVAGTTSRVVSAPWCGTDQCTSTDQSTDQFNPTAYRLGLLNKLNAILDELPNAGSARPTWKP